MRNKARELNAAMMDSNNLFGNVFSVNDRRGRYMFTVNRTTAKQMIESGLYYIEMTTEIVMM